MTLSPPPRRHEAARSAPILHFRGAGDPPAGAGETFRYLTSDERGGHHSSCGFTVTPACRFDISPHPCKHLRQAQRGTKPGLSHLSVLTSAFGYLENWMSVTQTKTAGWHIKLWDCFQLCNRQTPPAGVRLVATSSFQSTRRLGGDRMEKDELPAKIVSVPLLDLCTQQLDLQSGKATMCEALILMMQMHKLGRNGANASLGWKRDRERTTMNKVKLQNTSTCRKPKKDILWTETGQNAFQFQRM